MKKLFSFMLASALCAVLMGCGDEDKSSSATTTKTEKAVEKPVKKKGDPLKDAKNDVEAMRLKDFMALVLDSGCDVSPTAAQSLGADYEFDYNFHKTTLACEGKFKKFNNIMKKQDLNKIKKNHKDFLEYIYIRVNDINEYIDKNGEFGSLKDMIIASIRENKVIISDDEIVIDDTLYKLDRKNSTLIIGPITDESDEKRLMISQLELATRQYFIEKGTDFPLSIEGDNIVAKIDLNAKENAKKEVEAMSLKEFYKFYKNGGCDTYKEFLNHKAKIACEEKFKTHKDKLDKQIKWQKDYPFAFDEWFLYNSLADINDYVIANKKFGNLEDMSSNPNKEEVKKLLEATNGVKIADSFLGFSKADMDSKNLTITLHSIDKNTMIEVIKSWIKQDIEKEKLKDEPNAEKLKSLEEYLAESSSAEGLKKFDENFEDALLRQVASEVAIEEGALKTIVQATTKDGKFVVKFPFDDTKAISDEAKKYANQTLSIIDDIRKYYQKHKKFHTDINKMINGYVSTAGYDKDSFYIDLCVDGKLDRANATLTLSQSQRYGKSRKCKKILADESMVNIMSENGGVYSLK